MNKTSHVADDWVTYTQMEDLQTSSRAEQIQLQPEDVFGHFKTRLHTFGNAQSPTHYHFSYPHNTEEIKLEDGTEAAASALLMCCFHYMSCIDIV